MRKIGNLTHRHSTEWFKISLLQAQAACNSQCWQRLLLTKACHGIFLPTSVTRQSLLHIDEPGSDSPSLTFIHITSLCLTAATSKHMLPNWKMYFYGLHYACGGWREIKLVIKNQTSVTVKHSLPSLAQKKSNYGVLFPQIFCLSSKSQIKSNLGR